MGNVLVVGTCDTKGPELAYLRDGLRALGRTPTVVDAGILGEPVGITPDIGHAEVAERGGTTLAALQQAGSRGRAVAKMCKALVELATGLYRDEELDAVVGLGGAEGAVMAAEVMKALPVGVPKVLASPIASGKHYFGPLVGTRDVMVVHSVVDIHGLNPVATTVFDNVAAAVDGMLASGHTLPAPEPGAHYVAVTMLGNTTTAVGALTDRLESHGYEAVVFHSNGVGGPAMEELAAAGQFVGVIDFTTNEVTDPLTGGIHDGGPERLGRIGPLGVPQVVVPGCIDFSAFAAGTVPPTLADRPVYDHNPEFTLVRTSAEEMARIGELFADRLNQSRGPLRVAIPTQGLSIPNTPGGEFWDPTADAAFSEALRARLRADVPVSTHERHVNETAFGEEVAGLFAELMEKMEKEASTP
jgi:uncharacterized protein (UPF0261 family)